jgi:hypothetical protein
MGEEVKYQLRLTLSDPFAEVARNFPDIRRSLPSRNCYAGTTRL